MSIFLLFLFILSSSIILSNSILIQNSNKDRLLWDTHNPSKPNKPIVLIPGILGSILEARLNKTTAPHYICYKRSDWFQMWLNAEILVPMLGSCWVENLKLVYSSLSTSSGVKNATGVEIRTPNFGNPEGSIDKLDYYGKTNYFGVISDTFVARYGYERNKSLLAAPYDWRLAPNIQNNSYCIKLQNLIERGYNTNGHQKVMIIAHSMGNLYFHYCSHRVWRYSWKTKYIYAYAALGPPFAGAPKSLVMITCGENESIPSIRPNTLAIAEKTWPSTYFLMPNRSAMTKTKRQTNFITIDNSRNFTASQYHELFKFQSSSFINSSKMYAEYSGESLLGEVPPLGYKTLCAYGIGWDTVGSLKWNKRSKFPDYNPDEITEPGDGTVPEWSSGDVCKRWKKLQKPDTVKLMPMHLGHVGLLWSIDIINEIADMMHLRTDDDHL